MNDIHSATLSLLDASQDSERRIGAARTLGDDRSDEARIALLALLRRNNEPSELMKAVGAALAVHYFQRGDYLDAPLYLFDTDSSDSFDATLAELLRRDSD